jgi:hypothetical protein
MSSAREKVSNKSIAIKIENSRFISMYFEEWKYLLVFAFQFWLLLG